MPELKMTFEFTVDGKRHDFYSRKLQISDDPVEGAEEWVYYIDSFLNQTRIAILPHRNTPHFKDRIKDDPEA